MKICAQNNFSIGSIVSDTETLGFTNADCAVWLVNWLFLKRRVDVMMVIVF